MKCEGLCTEVGSRDGPRGAWRIGGGVWGGARAEQGTEEVRFEFTTGSEFRRFDWPLETIFIGSASERDPRLLSLNLFFSRCTPSL